MTIIERPSTARYALQERERRRRRPWELLIPLLALLVGLLTFALAEGRDHDDVAATATAPRPAAATPTYRIDGTNLDPALARPPLGQLAPATVVATRATVLAIAGRPNLMEAHDDERFWVGDLAHPVLVFLHIPDEPAFTITPRSHVSFRGTIQPLPQPLDRLEVDPSQIGTLLRTGGYVEITDPNALTVTP